MNDKVSAFFAAAKAEPELGNKVQAVYGDAATAVAARLSELSQGTAYAFSAEELLNQGGLSDDQLDGVSGGAGVGYSYVDYHSSSQGRGQPKPSDPLNLFTGLNNFKFR